jgi:signal transduction histidine kinase
MLKNLINDMMDLAKSEKMKFELNNEYFDLTKSIERALDNMSYMAKSKKINSSI